MCTTATLNLQTINLTHAPSKVCFVCQKFTDRGSKVSTNRGHLDIQESLKKYVGLDVPEGWICRLCKTRLHGIKRKVEQFRKSVIDAQRIFRQQEVGKITITPGGTVLKKTPGGTVLKKTPGGTVLKKNQDNAIKKKKEVIVLTEKRMVAIPKVLKVKSKQPEQKPVFRTIFPKSWPATFLPKRVVGKGSVTGSSGQVSECPPVVIEPSNVLDHPYAAIKGQPKEVPPTKEVKLLQGVLARTPTLIDRAQYYCLLSAMQSQSTDIITTELLRIPSLRESLVGVLSDELGGRPDRQKGHKVGETSVLMLKNFLDLKMHSWEDIICEFITKYPELVEILLKIMLNPEARKSTAKIQQIIPKLATVYGIVLQQRNHELSRVQRLVGCLFADNVVEQKVYDRLNKLGVCSSYNRMHQVRRGVAALCIPAESNSKKRKAQKYAGTPGFSEIGEMFDQETDVVRRAR